MSAHGPLPDARDGRTRALVETAVVAVAIQGYAWLRSEPPERRLDAVVGLAIVAFMAFAVWRSGPADRRSFGLAAGHDHRRSLAPLAALTLVALVGVVAYGWSIDRLRPRWDVLRALATYPFSGLLQQAIVLGFFYPRLRRAFGEKRAPLLTAVLFAVIHAPNGMLMIGGGLVSFGYAKIWQRHPSLPMTALSHGVLGAVCHKCLDVSMRIGHGHLLLAVLLGCLLPTIGCRESEGPSRPTVAATIENPATSLDPALRPALDLVADGRNAEARELVGAYLQRGDPAPLSYQAEFVLGYTWQRQKQYARARTHFERAIAQAPGYAAPHHFLGFCLYYLGELDGAREAFETHLTHDPNEGDSHFGLGLVAFDEDRLDDAESHLQRALDLHRARHARSGDRAREVAKCRVRLADVALRRGRLESAREQLESAARTWPSHAETWYKLAQVQRRLGDTRAADEAQRRHEALSTPNGARGR